MCKLKEIYTDDIRKGYKIVLYDEKKDEFRSIYAETKLRIGKVIKRNSIPKRVSRSYIMFERALCSVYINKDDAFREFNNYYNKHYNNFVRENNITFRNINNFSFSCYWHKLILKYGYYRLVEVTFDSADLIYSGVDSIHTYIPILAVSHIDSIKIIK